MVIDPMLCGEHQKVYTIVATSKKWFIDFECEGAPQIVLNMVVNIWHMYYSKAVSHIHCIWDDMAGILCLSA